MGKLKLLCFVTIFVVLLSAGCKKKEEAEAPLTETTPTTGAPSGGAGAFSEALATSTVKGKASFKGQAPSKNKIQMSAEPICMKSHPEPVYSQQVEVNDNGTLQYVLVYVKEGAEKWTYKPPQQPVVLDQKGCMYDPHVFAIQIDQPLKILNSDPILHNIHSWPKINTPFNLGMPNKGMEFTRKFTKPEIVPIRCDVHKWMSAFAGVFPHPFHSVTGKDGTFSLKLPPGDYVIEAWHEKFGTQSQKVTIADKETKEIEVTFQPGATASLMR